MCVFSIIFYLEKKRVSSRISTAAHRHRQMTAMALNLGKKLKKIILYFFYLEKPARNFSNFVG